MLNLFSTDRTSIFIALLMLVATGCSSEAEPAEKTERGEIQTTRVEVTTVPDRYEALGSIRSTTRSLIASKLMGTIVSVSVDEGDRVQADTSLLRIDSAETDARIRKAEAGLAEVDQAIAAAQAALAGADASLELATATFRRYETLRDRGSVSPQEFEEVQAKFRAAKSGREQAARHLEALRAKREQALADLSTARTYGAWARVISPVDGVVTARHVDVGDVVSPGMPLVSIDDPTEYRLDVQVDESRLSAIRVGDPVTVQIESLGLTVGGEVSAIAPAVDPATRTALVKIDLPDSTDVQSGMFARVWFDIGERKAVVIPSSLIIRRGQLQGVYLLDESGEPAFRLIQTGLTIGDQTEILSGVAEGDRIVTGEPTDHLESRTQKRYEGTNA